MLARENRDDPRQDADFWREGIRRLTRADGGVDDSAWTLLVEDPTRPAFMQAPTLRPSDLNNFKPIGNTPDALDLLPTARNHDIKSTRVAHPEADHWIFAIVSLQTMSGVYGRGQFGIARMNTGHGNRPVVAMDYDRRSPARWRDHTRRTLKLRPTVIGGEWGFTSNGLVCTWAVPWDLTTSIPIHTLDPFFLEISRSRRLVETPEGITILSGTTSAPRIAARGLRGVMGDPWSPVNRRQGDPSTLTVSAKGLTPELLRDLIFQDGFALTELQKPDPTRRAQGADFTVAVLVRGQGTTEGIHQASIRIPGAANRCLFVRGPDYDRLASLSKTAIEDSGAMQREVLKPAVLSLLEGGPSQVSEKRREVGEWWNKTQQEFTAAWSEDYFPWLWHSVEHDDSESSRIEWLESLRGNAESTLVKAIAQYPTRSARRYRAQVRARRMFLALLYKHFPALAPPPAETTKVESNDEPTPFAHHNEESPGPATVKEQHQ